MISVTVATGLAEAIAAAGGRPDEIPGVRGLQRKAQSNPDGFIASLTFARILEDTARATGDRCFGLHFGERFDPRDVGALAYVVVNSPTIAVAIQNIERYLRIHNSSASVAFSIEGERGYLRYTLSDLDGHLHRQQNEYSMAVMLKAFRTLAAPGWQPLEVRFMHARPQDTSEHLRVSGCAIAFGCDANTMVVERDFVDRVVPHADPRLYRILKQHVERILGEMPQENEQLLRMRAAIGEAMRHGDPTLARVARNLSMTPRTLQRRLQEHGVAYRALVNDTRRRFALNYLRDRRLTLTEVAFLLGYSEVSAFNRAFKRDTGSTPLEYRDSCT